MDCDNNGIGVKSECIESNRQKNCDKRAVEQCCTREGTDTLVKDGDCTSSTIIAEFSQSKCTEDEAATACKASPESEMINYSDTDEVMMEIPSTSHQLDKLQNNHDDKDDQIMNLPNKSVMEKEMDVGTVKSLNESDTMKENEKRNETVIDLLSSGVDLPESSRTISSQDDSLTSNENTSSCDQNKAKRTMSKEQVNGDSGISMEKSENSSDEDGSKRQKTTESLNTSAIIPDDEMDNNQSKFHKLKSKVRKRNYRVKKRLGSGIGDDSNETTFNESMNSQGQGSYPEVYDGPETLEERECADEPEVYSDEHDQDGEDGGDSSEWTTVSEDNLDDEEETPLSAWKKKPKPKWFVVPEVTNRQLGNNKLFQRRFYGSLHAVQRLELMYKLNEHQGCVNALNFNQKGNLLASASDDLSVVIWDWAIGKKRHCFQTGHRSNVFQAKWLPLNMEYLMVTCARDGQVRLIDLLTGSSRKIATHHGSTHKLAIHPDTPQTIISIGEDAKILSIDIRQSKPTRLLVVKEGTMDVQLYSVDSNPLNSNEFCVSGRDQYVRAYDRRKISTPLHKLCPKHLKTNDKLAYITCAVYNYNGSEILASYNDEDIYLFDTLLPYRSGDVAHRYQGHRNSATVKGVNFFGPKSEFIVSGSDCGNIFFWDKSTEAIVQWMAGDEQGVTNCLEPHPHIPILATSGLDYDVKIWVPSCEEPPAMKNLDNCIKSNLKNRALEITSESNFFDDELWILWRFIQQSERFRNRNASRSEDRDGHDDSSSDNDSSNLSDSSNHSDDQPEENSEARLQCSPS